MNDQQLSTQPNPFALTTFDQVKELATHIAASKVFGFKEPAQAITAMMLAHEEGKTLSQLMREIHFHEDGKISQRADYTQAEFEKGHTIIWHIRTDEEVCGTFIRGREITDEQRERGMARYELLQELEDLKYTEPREASKEQAIKRKLIKLSREGEETVLRTLRDADFRGISQGSKGTKSNWQGNPRAMLQWRCATEGVKAIDPSKFSGRASDVDLQDLKIIEDRIRHRVITEPKPGDKQAILEIIAGYDEELGKADLADGRRKHLLGLRQDLNIKLDEMGLQRVGPAPSPTPTVAGVEAKTVETVVLPPETTQKAPSPRRTRQPAPQPAEATQTTQKPDGEQDENTPWQEFKSHVGAAGSIYLDTLGNAFAKATNQKRLDAIVTGFHAMLSASTQPKDVLLWKKVEEAKAAWQPPTTPEPASTPTTAGSTETTAKPAEAPRTPAQPTSWRDYTITIKSETLTGKKLGDLDIDDLKRIQTEYFDKIDPKRYTLEQKKFKAHLTSALTELLPPAATSETEEFQPDPNDPQHTQALKQLVEYHRLNRNSFMQLARENGYCGATATRLEDFTEDEVTAIIQGEKQIVAEVKAIQP